MDLIVGVTMVLILMIFLLVFCKNITVNLNVNYPEPVEFKEIEDNYDAKGDVRDKELDEYDWNKVIEEFNKIMLEEENDG